jgi:hypothetical protein
MKCQRTTFASIEKSHYMYFAPSTQLLRSMEHITLAPFVTVTYMAVDIIMMKSFVGLW